jgi:hypothetical protein
MNGKIAFSMFISFIITTASLILLANSYSDIGTIDQNHSFFKQDFDSDRKKIFLLGSSQVGRLNSTLIVNGLSQNYPNYDFYNLAHAGDNPEERLAILPKIISLEPSTIFYGISYRDISNKQNTHQNENQDVFNLDFVLKKIDPDNKSKLKNINPLYITIGVIYTELKNNNLIPSIVPPDVYSNIMPFYCECKFQYQIMNHNELEKHAMSVQTLVVDPPSSNEQVLNLKKIIEELQKNDIQIIIFINPLSLEYTNSLSIETKNNFKEFLNEIENEFSLKIYDLTYDYGELPIWADSLHIITTPESIIYSENTLQMIVKEIEK